MSKFRHILLFCILTAVALPLKAQDDFLKLGLRTGHNTVFGGFAAVSLESTCALCDDFSLNGGLKYNTTGKTDIAARPSYFHDFTWGRISAEVLLNYTRLASVNGMAVGGGAGISGKWIGFRLGYFYRLYGSKAGMIEEPFNIYYELRANLLPMGPSADDYELRNFRARKAFPTYFHSGRNLQLQGSPWRFIGYRLQACRYVQHVGRLL